MKIIFSVLILTSLILADFNFISLADTRNRYDGGLSAACAAASEWSPKLLISPGDMDPVKTADSIIQKNIGPNFPWFISVGNHETEHPEDLLKTKKLIAKFSKAKGISNFTFGPKICPKTNYSFVYTDSSGITVQYVCIDGYSRGKIQDTKALMTPKLLEWLTSVLSKSKADYIIAFSHPPVFPKVRHLGDSWNGINKDLIDDLWNVLLKYKVSAYFCGHTHYNYWMAIDNFKNWKAQEVNFDPNRGCIQIDVGALRSNNGDLNTSILVKIDVTKKKLTYSILAIDGKKFVLKESFSQKKKRF